MLRVVTGHASRCRLKVFYPRANIWRAVSTALPVVNGKSQRSRPGSLQCASRFLLSGRLTGQCQLQEFHVNSSLSSASPSTADGRLIYVGNLAKTVLGVKFFSYSTSMFSLFAVPYVMLKTGFGVDSMALQIAFYSIMGFFTFVTPVTLHLLTKGYVVRLYHKPETDTYTAVTYNVFLAEKRTVFHQKDVEVPGVSRMFTTFYAQSKSMLVNPMLFFTPQEYSHLMGYDKAFTFDMEDLKDLEDK